MTNSTTRKIVATYEDLRSARDGVRALITAGIPAAHIGVLVADSAEARELLEEGPGKPGESAAIGSAVGGALSGLAAVALAGPVGVLAVGPLVALFGGAAAGAGAGGVAGALIGLGIPAHEAALRVESVLNGGAIVTCDSDDSDVLAKAEDLLRQHSPRDVFES